MTARQESALINANGFETHRKVTPIGGMRRVGVGVSPEDVPLFELVLKDEKLFTR